MAGGIRASSPHFVGRREELSRAEALLDAARTGTASVALVAGDAGIGKTRFVQELTRRAAAVDMTVLSGGCIDLGEDSLPYAPFVHMLRSLISAEGVAFVLELAGPTADELARLAPEVAVGGVIPEVSRASFSRLYLALTSLIQGLTRRRPLLIVVEDLHWADRSTRDLLALLASNAPRRCLIVATLRTDESPDDPTLRRFTAELERASAHRITLKRLTRGDQARQISGILGVPPPSALVDRIYARADGNPFFAEELLALEGSGSAVPTTVRDLLQARVEALPASTQGVLRAAAAAGRRVSHGLLTATVDLDGAALDDALRDAVGNHVLTSDADDAGAYVFRHSLQQEAIAAALLPGEAVRLHRRLAEALTADPALALEQTHAVAGRIAHHWQAAGDAARTLEASVRAAQEAEKALAFTEALAHYTRAVALIDEVPDADSLLPMPRYQLLWAAAETAHLAAFPARAADLVRGAIAACAPAGGIADDPAGSTASVNRALHYAYLHERLGRYLWMAADGKGAMASYERAMELVPKDPPTCWRAAIVSGYAQILMLAGRFSESTAYCHEAIALTEHPLVENARSTQGHARNNLGVNLALLGDAEAGIEQLQLARVIAEEEFDDVDDIGRAIVNLHSVLYDFGRYEEAAAVALEGIFVIDRLGLQRRKGVWCRCDAAESLLALGRYDEALRLTDESLALAPSGVDGVRTHLVRGRVLLQRGDLEGAWRHLAEARERSGRVIDGQINAPLFTALAECALWRGDAAAALELAGDGLGRLLADEDAAYVLPLVAAGARAAVESGSPQLAEAWMHTGKAAIDRDAARKPSARAHMLTARAELSHGRDRGAASLWDAAAAAWTDLKDPYAQGYARWRQAEALLGVGEDRAAAAAALRDAWTGARSCGAMHLVAVVEDLARRSRVVLEPDGGSRAEGPPRHDPFGLTAREREVLELVAEGYADRQIGERLFISHRTVERHVSNILGKVGAVRRSEVPAIAYRTGLVTSPRP